ncbi:MAG TPA: ABC transporter permease [Bryobacteraceae bacterium]|jgi:hypothetical protein|nr:ABC transporter permease [Bryobacteraceae bacterium]
MKALRAGLSRLLGLIDRDLKDREFAEELASHMELHAEDNRRAGMTPEEARRAAHIRLGGIEATKEAMRDQRGVPALEAFLQDLRYGLRMLGRNPGFAALAVAIMALGIGANTAVFSVVNAVLLKPLAWRDPDRIVTLANPSRKGHPVSRLETKLVSIPNFNDWHGQSSSFEAMAYYNYAQGPVMSGATAEYAQLAGVSPGFFHVFGVTPVVGRFFSADEEKPGSNNALLISYAYWQSHFGGDPHVAGRTIRVYGKVTPIVGVLPPGFHFPDKTDIWGPHDEPVTAKSRGSQEDFVVGLLKPGVSL